jgi:hypothetical protein
MPNGLRERFADLSDAGVSFAELVVELDTYKGQMSRRRYDELWLFCWSVSKRQAARPVSGRNGTDWPDLHEG